MYSREHISAGFAGGLVYSGQTSSVIDNLYAIWENFTENGVLGNIASWITAAASGWALSVAGSTVSNSVDFSNRSMSFGSFEFGSGDDAINVAGGSYVYAPFLDLGSGNNRIELDSSASLNAYLTGNFDLAITLAASSAVADEYGILHLVTNPYTFSTYIKSFSVDVQNAEIGTYALVDTSEVQDTSVLSERKVALKSGSTDLGTLSVGDNVTVDGINYELQLDSENYRLDLNVAYVNPVKLYTSGVLTEEYPTLSNQTIKSSMRLEVFSGGTISKITNSGGTISMYSGALAGGGTNTYGGAIINNSGKINVQGSTFSQNKATTYGGAIFNSGVSELTNAVASDNRATYGAVIYNANVLTLAGGEYSNNIVTQQGGVIYNNSGFFSVDGATFGEYSNNIATFIFDQLDKSMVKVKTTTSKKR